MNNGSCSESEVKEGDDEESARAASPATTATSEKKRKKKRKKATRKALAARSSEDNLEMEDEIDASVKWVEENLGPARPH